jgi:hypothetical protein
MTLNESSQTEVDDNTAVDTQNVVFSDSTPPSFQDMQAWQQELMLDMTADKRWTETRPLDKVQDSCKSLWME